LERQALVDQQPHPALAILAARPGIFARQGSIVATWRRRGARTYGPYFRLAYRNAGRQTSIYLGREGQANEIVENVRQKLAALQQPLQHCRALDRLRRHVTAALRLQKLKLDAQLRPFGLRLQGFEVRGWRTSPLRPALQALRRPTRRTPRTRQLRLYPQGNAAAALRKKKQSIPAAPQARLDALRAARRQRDNARDGRPPKRVPAPVATRPACGIIYSSQLRT
jgi:hypothetical protein